MDDNDKNIFQTLINELGQLLIGPRAIFACILLLCILAFPRRFKASLCRLYHILCSGLSTVFYPLAYPAFIISGPLNAAYNVSQRFGVTPASALTRLRDCLTNLVAVFSFPSAARLPNSMQTTPLSPPSPSQVPSSVDIDTLAADDSKETATLNDDQASDTGSQSVADSPSPEKVAGAPPSAGSSHGIPPITEFLGKPIKATLHPPRPQRANRPIIGALQAHRPVRTVTPEDAFDNGTKEVTEPAVLATPGGQGRRHDKVALTKVDTVPVIVRSKADKEALGRCHQTIARQNIRAAEQSAKIKKLKTKLLRCREQVKPPIDGDGFEFTPEQASELQDLMLTQCPLAPPSSNDENISLRAELESVRTQLAIANEQIDVQNNQLGQGTQIIGEQQAMLQQYAVTYTEYQALCKASEEKLVDAKRNSKSFSPTSQGTENKIKRLEAHIEELNIALSATQLAHNSLAELQAENDRLRKERDDAHVTRLSLEDMQKRIDELQATGHDDQINAKLNKDMQRRIDELQAANDAAQRDLSSLRKENQARLEGNKTLHQEYELAKLHVSSAQQESSAKDELIQDLHRRIAQIEIQPVSNSQTAELNALNSELRSLQADLARANIGLRDATTHNQALQHEMQQYQKQITDMSGEILNYASNREAMMAQGRKLEGRIDQMKVSESELQLKHCMELETARNAQRTYIEELQCKISALEADNTNAEVARLQQQITALFKEVDVEKERLQNEHAVKKKELDGRVRTARMEGRDAGIAEIQHVIGEKDRELAVIRSNWQVAIAQAVREALQKKDSEMSPQGQGNASTPSSPMAGVFSTPSSNRRHSQPISPNSRDAEMFSPRAAPPKLRELMMQKQCDQMIIDSLRKDKLKLEETTSTLQNELSKLEAERSDLRQENDDLMLETVEYQDSKVALQKDHEQLQESKKALEKELEDVKDKLSEAMIDMGMVDVEKDELSEEHRKELDLKNTQLDQYGQKYAEVTLQTQKLKEDNKALENAYHMEKGHNNHKALVKADVLSYQRDRAAYYGTSDPTADVTQKKGKRRIDEEDDDAVRWGHDSTAVASGTMKKVAPNRASELFTLCEATESDITAHAMTSWCWTEASHVSRLYYSLADAEEHDLARFEQFIAYLGASDLIQPRTQTQEEVEAAFQSLIDTPQTFVQAPPMIAGLDDAAEGLGSFNISNNTIANPPLLIPSSGAAADSLPSPSSSRRVLKPRLRGASPTRPT